MTMTYENLAPGYRIDGPSFAVSRETIRFFCEASLDFNPLHLRNPEGEAMATLSDLVHDPDRDPNTIDILADWQPIVGDQTAL